MTNIGAGIGGQAAIALESTYGTAITSFTTFPEVGKISHKLNKKTVQGSGLAAGRLVDLGSRRVVTTKQGSVTVPFDVVNKSMGKLWNLLFGGTVTPVQQAATTAYLQTFPLADTAGKSATLQFGIPETTGTVRTYTHAGAKVTGATFECGVDTLLTASFDCDSQSINDSNGQTLATASYPTLKPFHFGQMSVSVGAYGSEASISGVTKMSVKIERKMNTGRFYAGAAGLKAEPITSDQVQITGTISSDFVNKATFSDVYTADGNFSLIWNFTGANIASTYYEMWQLALPMCFLDSDVPSVDGTDVVNTGFGFSVLNDGTHAPATLTYMSTDTTL